MENLIKVLKARTIHAKCLQIFLLVDKYLTRKLIMASLASTAVALIVLADIATGQGPPALNNYLGGGPGLDYGRLPPGPLVGPPMRLVGGYGDEAKLEKEYEKDRAKYEKFDKKKDFKEFKELKKLDKEYEKEYKKGGYESEYEYGKTTPAPGYFDSISSGMSSAWNRLRGNPLPDE